MSWVTGLARVRTGTRNPGLLRRLGTRLFFFFNKSSEPFRLRTTGGGLDTGALVEESLQAI